MREVERLGFERGMTPPSQRGGTCEGTEVGETVSSHQLTLILLMISRHKQKSLRRMEKIWNGGSHPLVVGQVCHLYL